MIKKLIKASGITVGIAIFLFSGAVSISREVHAAALPVASYSFNEGQGTTLTDTSGNANHGTITGATWNTSGKYGNALNFNGNNNYVSINDSPTLDLTSAMTLQAWVRPSSLASWRSILLKEQSGNLVYALYANTDGNVPSGELFSGGNKDVRAVSALPSNTWTHIAATYDGSTLKFYVNGVETGSKPVSGAIATSNNPLRIGGNNVWGEYFHGQIDEIRIYDRALSPAEIQTDMNTAIDGGTTPTPTATAVPTPTPTNAPTPTPTQIQTPTQTPTTTIPPDSDSLVASYSFNEGQGTTLTDTSGNANHGTITGATWNTSGKYGNALNFNGNNNYVSINDSPTLDLSSAMTLQAWVRPSSLASWRSILLKEQSGNLVYALYANTDGNVPSGELFSGGNKDVRASSALPSNTWTHIAATYDGSTLKFYVNGVETGSKPVSGAIATSNNPLRIGGNNVWGEYFHGQIDEIRIYDRALSPAEIQSDMNTAIDGGTTPTPTATAVPTSTPTNAPSATPTLSPKAQKGEWSSTMNWPLVAVHAVLLNTGKVLMWDGWEIPSHARVWDPSNNTFISVTNQSGLFCSGHSMLEDGRIVVAGGHNEIGDGIRDTNIFDPATNTWTRAADMYQPRWYPSVTTLNDNRVLSLSGAGDSSGWADTPEIYDSIHDTWTQMTEVNTSDMQDDMYPHPYVLQDGTIYIISPTTGVVRKMNIEEKQWITMSPAPFLNSATVMYRPGKFMIAGGGEYYDNSQTHTAVIDLNESSPSWRSTESMDYPRYQHDLVILPDGDVLAVGGAEGVEKNSNDGTLQAELWDPETETWSTMASMKDPRVYHSIAMLLPDGRVLAAGGGRYGSLHNYLTAELYSPPYLFKGARPTISSAPSVIGYNSTISIETPNADSILKISFIPLPSVTHTMDMNQRYLELNFTKNATTLTAQTPLNTNLAPAGYYMVFIVNSDGVPSIAKIVQIKTDGTTPTPTATTVPTPTPTNAPTPTPTQIQTPTPTPTTTIPPDSLVASYSFNEGQGTTLTDTSGNANHGTITGATWNTSGKYGNALNFNGNNNYVSINDSPTLDLTSAMTLQAWVRPSSLASWRSILLKEQSGNLVYALYANTDGSVPNGEIYSGGNKDVRASSGLSLDTWTHIAATYDGSTLKFYVNGVETGSKPVSGAIATSNNPLRIGGNNVWGEYFHGQIDEIRIYDRALSPAEIQSDMNTGI